MMAIFLLSLVWVQMRSHGILAGEYWLIMRVFV